MSFETHAIFCQATRGSNWERVRITFQGRIQEFLIGGVQTLVQKGLLHSYEANYFLPPPPPPTSRGCTL